MDKKYDGRMGEGNITRELTPKNNWRYPKPNYIRESTFNKVCEEHQ